MSNFIPDWVPKDMTLVQLESLHDAQQNSDLDIVLGEEVARGERPATLRVWRSAPKAGLGVSKRDVSGEAGQAAKTAMQQAGWSVVVRQTGGTAVPQGEGVFHVSFLLPRVASNVTTDAYYRWLCRPIVAWLQAQGIEATVGALPGSYCDGSYNVLASDKKLAGTAQAWRGGLAGLAARHPGYVLAHACIIIDVNPDDVAQRINQFYELAKLETRVDARTIGTVRQLNQGGYAGLSAAAATMRAMEDFVKFAVDDYASLGIQVNQE